MFLALAAVAAIVMAAVPAAAQPVPGKTAPIRMAVLGDSLSAGYGLPGAAAFPARLQRSLAARGIVTDMVNAGVSGDTASGGRDRLDWSIADGTQAVIVELGANDGLRGIDPNVTREALDQILTRLKARGMAVFLCGMVAPPNYGDDYGARFNAIFPDLASKHGVPLYPFFLDGVAGLANLNQSDGMHPTAEGIDEVVKRITPAIADWLKPLAGR